MVYKQGRITKHFDAAKLFLVMVGLILIVFVYWYIASTYISASKIYSQAAHINSTISYSLPFNSNVIRTFGTRADICTFNYPARWVIKTLPSNSIWYAQLSPIELSRPLGGSAFLNISPVLQAQSNTAASISDVNFYNLKPLNTPTPTTINGYTVYYGIFQDPNNNWTYKNYYFFDKSSIIEFSFVDSIPKTVKGTTSTLNLSKYTAEESALLSSVHINL